MISIKGKMVSLLCLWPLFSGCLLSPVPGMERADEGEGLGRSSAQLVVFAAASLQGAFTELGQTFMADHPGARVVFNFAGSQQLAQQLNQGAPVDILASADEQQMGVAIESGRVPSGTARLFARNKLAVIYPTDNPAGIVGLEDLARPGVKLVLGASPVPVGRYTLGFLENASVDPGLGLDYKARVLANVVSFEENVKAVLTKVALGEADAGIVYASDITPSYRTRVGSLGIPDRWNVVAWYPIAIVGDSRDPELAEEFIATLLSPTGQGILAERGFIPVGSAGVAD